MALSYVQYPGNGSTKAFDVTFGYLSRSHVFAFIDDELVAFSWTSPSRIELADFLPAGSTITIRRLTDRVNRVTTFTDGQTLLAGDLNAGDLQNFYIVQEMLDQVSDGVLSGVIAVQNPGTGYITEQWIQDQLQASVVGSAALIQLSNQISAETAARTSAISAEAAARVAALLNEANARTAALTAEATARAAAVQAEAAARAADVSDIRADLAATVLDLEAAASDLAAEVASRLAADTTIQALIVSEASTRSTADSAFATSLNAVIADLATTDGSLRALVAAEESARVTAVSAEAAARGLLAARVTQAESDIDAAEAAIITEQTVRANADSAEATARGLIAAEVAAARGGQANLNARIAAEESARASGDSAEATARGILAARVTQAETDIDAAEAAIVTEQSVRASADSAAASRLNALEATVNTAGTGLSARVLAAESAITDLDSTKAEASALSSLTAEVTNARNGGASLKARIDSEESARVSADSAASGRITALETSVNTAGTGLLARVTSAESTITDIATNKASASSVSALTSRVTTAEGEIDTLQSDASTLAGRVTTAEANIISEASTRATADSAAAGRLNALESTVNTPTTGLSAKVTSVETTVADHTANKASASSVTALSARVSNGLTSDFPKTFVHGLWTTQEGTYTPTDAELTPASGFSTTSDGKKVFTTSAGFSGVIATVANFAPVAGRTYRVRWTVRKKTAGTNGRPSVAYPYFMCILSDGTPEWLADTVSSTDWAAWAVGTVQTVTTTWTAPTTVSGKTIAWARPRCHYNWDNAGTSFSDSVYEFLGFDFEDRTELKDAEANITTLQSAVVDLSANKATVTDLSTLTARVAAGEGSGALNVNARFAAPYTTANSPPGWADWEPPSAGTQYLAKPSGAGSTMFLTSPAGLQAGTQQPVYGITAGNKYVIAGEIYRSSGAVHAAGVYVGWYNESWGYVGDSVLPFASTPTTDGYTGTAPVGVKRYEKIVTAPAGATRCLIYAMSNWGGYGSMQANALFWYEASISPVRLGEAGVETLKAAIATGNSAEATLFFKVNTATNFATLRAYAGEGDGVWNGSIIELSADYIKFNGSVIINGSLNGTKMTDNTLDPAKIVANSLTKAATATGSTTIAMTTSYQDLAEITVNIPSGASLVRLDWSLYCEGASNEGGDNEMVVRVLRDGTDITGDITTLKLQATMAAQVYNSGVMSADDLVKVQDRPKGTFAFFIADIGASSGNRVYKLQAKRLNTNGTLSVGRRIFFGTAHAR